MTNKGCTVCGATYKNPNCDRIDCYRVDLEIKVDKINPKDKIGLTKIPIGLLPSTGVLWGAIACKDGADKYGAYNWREQKIKYMVYLDALLRHIYCLLDGEDYAKDSDKHHIGHIIATASILADALENKCVEDDRPVNGRASELMEAYNEKVSN